MDPCTQTLLGATVASSFSKKDDLKKASLFGAIGGIIPDFDVFISSSEDNLLFIEYHRHFSHSIFFIPFGGLIISFILFLLFKSKISFSNTYLYCTLGLATHGLLDSCTTYGTSLLWPFSDSRIAWNIISIVDPIFTSILLFFIIFFLLKKSISIIRFGLALSLIYLSLGINKNLEVKSFITQIAKNRGHEIERLMVNPTIGNIILWRTIYQSENKYYVDAVYAPFVSETKIREGINVNVIDKETVFPILGRDSKQRNDIKRFSYFTNDYIYIHPDNEFIISDLRYGTLPHDNKSLWGIEIDTKNPDKHVNFKNLRKFNHKVYSNFWNMLNGDF